MKTDLLSIMAGEGQTRKFSVSFALFVILLVFFLGKQPCNARRCDLKVSKGQLTFDAEGNNNPRSRYFSRVPHWPGGNSGVTIGRGYDLSEHTKNQILRDMRSAGVDSKTARLLAGATRKKGRAARNYMKRQLKRVNITCPQQKKLFEITYSEMERDVRRIVNKRDVVRDYGRTNWNALHPAIKDLLIDLRYRGDYTRGKRRVIQRYVAQNNLKRLTKIMSNRNNWRSVPYDRFRRRKEYMQKA